MTETKAIDTGAIMDEGFRRDIAQARVALKQVVAVEERGSVKVRLDHLHQSLVEFFDRDENHLDVTEVTALAAYGDFLANLRLDQVMAELPETFTKVYQVTQHPTLRRWLHGSYSTVRDILSTYATAEEVRELGVKISQLARTFELPPASVSTSRAPSRLRQIAQNLKSWRRSH